MHDEKLRKRAHLMISTVFIIFILLFRSINSTSVIDAIYILVSYTYGPLLGLYSFGLLTKYRANDKVVPYIAVTSPFICYGLDILMQRFFAYHFGYELLMLNGTLTFLGLYLTRINQKELA